jgi:hypothetical protein
MPRIYLESHGVKLDVEITSDALLPAVHQILPPDWTPLTEFPEDGHFLVTGDGPFEVLADGAPVASDLSAELAVHVLDAQLRSRIAFLARDRIFVHAGVAAREGQAIVIPAPSFAGKSSLVAALVAAGATYYSDEFAVLDGDGRVHPYPKPLSLRAAYERYGDRQTAEGLGGNVGEGPADVSLIVVTRFVPGAEWSPTRRDSGVGALALLTNAIPAQARAREATRATARAAVGAVVLEGERGEARIAAERLFQILDSPNRK